MGLGSNVSTSGAIVHVKIVYVVCIQKSCFKAMAVCCDILSVLGLMEYGKTVNVC